MTAPIIEPTEENIANAVGILQAGGLVAMPTETVYGLACDAGNAAAVANLYSAKGRPSFNPLIAHVPDLGWAKHIGRMDETALSLAEAHWPGPLTLVVPVADEASVCDLARAGLTSVAIRQPAHPIAAALLQAFDGPLVAPSANPSGRISPTCAHHVALDMGAVVDLILDGGPSHVGVESTIISCLEANPVILRYGAVLPDTVAMAPQDPAKPIAPGGLTRHYAPEAHLTLNAAQPVAGAAYLGFGPGESTCNLSEQEDLTEAAANLFAMLRELDQTWDQIAVAPVPMRGLGLAINDRLARAAKRG